MQKAIFTGAGDHSVISIQSCPEPVPSENEVLVDVKASGVNFADILARQGLYPDAPPLPMCVGYEFSGVVKAVGSKANEDWIGQPVFGLSRFNAYASQVVVPVDQLFKKPDSLSFEQAAAIPVNYLTAWQLLVVMGALQPDDTVLIHNVGGGVGLAALEIARHIGATTIGTASSGKHAFLKERGLDHAIDYRQGDWLPEVMQLTGNRGVELIIDPMGGSHWKQSYKALRSSGRLGMFGISTASESRLFGKLKLVKVGMQMPFFHPVSLMNENKSVFGVNMGHLWHEVPKIRSWMGQILKGVDEGWIHPHVDKTFALESVAQAHQYVEARQNKGKVILIPERK